jgi:hypothetical protein
LPFPGGEEVLDARCRQAAGPEQRVDRPVLHRFDGLVEGQPLALDVFPGIQPGRL